MNWQLLGLTFMTVFIAEIGDKSQLAAIALGGSSQHPRAVFFGSVAALLLASSIGVLAGGEIGICTDGSTIIMGGRVKNSSANR
jgi:putative Ca2+/H+ antiporter (TMEM165/GDT1 family)